jgi:phosphopentomutase
VASDRIVSAEIVVRALVIVLDSAGIAGAGDAEKDGDSGASTLGHVLERTPDLPLPNLFDVGLPELLDGSQFERARRRPYRASFGRMQERSVGKDTTTGHWEIAGVILKKPFALFEKFPEELVEAIERESGVRFIGNYARSGTTIP